ncbi:type IX secretion system motor protein PorM/GldM [Aureispira anguillae]|uniref:Gliding motility protein GldM n=1 Tax=Aureispira anguillae TaxID=2864201 RepID=A0A915YIQ3_9BACT|nr:GldM family protein [Aureispira anguillae]BDS13904.1 gliding motility protein GldM [Aureispira anguillae]
MSIPKEPRQLMINLMYLVLTAMLALNVSAEIINAFFMLDKGIKKNNKIVEHSVSGVITSMEETAKTKTQYQPLVDKAKEAKTLTTGFDEYINSLRERMIEESGGAYTDQEAADQGHPELAGKPRGKKDKDTPQRIFVSGDYGSEGKKQPEGEVLEQKILDLRKAYLDFVAGLWEGQGIKGTIFADPTKKEGALKTLEAEMTLTSSENYNAEAHENKTWADYTFGHMPVAAIYPMLRKFQNDARTSESAVVNFLAGQMGKLELNYDKFDVFSQSSKPYILLGETYEADIALGAYSSQAKFSVSVGGSSLKIVDGKAKYSARGSSVGQKTYSAKISVNNPLTGETETFTKEFSYEVGQPSVNVSADKMNVFYIGVPNPVTVAAAGVATSAMKVSMTGGKLTKKSGTNYTVTADRPGEATITVKDTKNGKSFPFKFRVKRIPDPVVRLGKKTDGLMGSGEFKAQPGLAAWLDNFDFDARCQVQSYTLYYTRKRQDPVEIQGKGGRFSGKVSAAIRQAKPGDQYAFTDVKARCPGDKAGRRVNGLAFKVK